MPVAEKDFGAAFVEDDLAAGADFAFFGDLTYVVFVVAPDHEIEDLVGVGLIDIDEQRRTVGTGSRVFVDDIAADGPVLANVLGSLSGGQDGLHSLCGSERDGEAEDDGTHPGTHADLSLLMKI